MGACVLGVLMPFPLKIHIISSAVLWAKNRRSGENPFFLSSLVLMPHHGAVKSLHQHCHHPLTDRNDSDVESDDDIRLPPTFQYNSRQSTRDITQSRKLTAASTRGLYDRPPIWKGNSSKDSSPPSTDSSSYRPTR